MLRFALLLLALGLAVAATAVAQPPPTIAPQAKASGVDVGGLTLTDAARRIDAHLDAPLEVRVGGRHLHLGRRAFEVDALATAQRALAAGGDDVEAVVSVNHRRLDRFLDRVERAGTRKPRSARLRYTVTKLKVVRSRRGLRVDRDAAREQIEQALEDPPGARIIRVELRHVEPQVTTRELRERDRTVVTIHRRGFRLRLFKGFDQVASYRVAVGMPGHETPRGRFEITSKAVDPAWSAPDRAWAGAYRNEVIAGGSAENPLKARWLGIVNGVGIHGTGATWSLGHAASHGCIRMSVPDVKALYERVPLGTLVMIK